MTALSNNTDQGKIVAHDLSLSPFQALWIVLSFLLAAALSQLVCTWLSTPVRSHWCLIGALSLMPAGSVASALAKGFLVLTIGRVLDGICCGIVLALSPLVFRYHSRDKPLPWREAAMSLPFWLGAGVGPVVAAAVTASIGWQRIFWINLPICAFALTLLSASICETVPAQRLCAKQRTNTTATSWVLVGTSVTSISMGLIWSTGDYSWSSWPIVLPLVAGLSGIVCSIIYLRLRDKLIYHSTFIHNAGIYIATFSTFMHGLVFAATVSFLSIFFSSTRPRHSLVAMGALVLPSSLGPFFVATTLDAIRGLTSNYGTAVPLGWLVTTTSCGLFMLLDEHSGLSTVIPLGLFMALGLGLLTSSLPAAMRQLITARGEPTDMVMFRSSFANTLGQALGISIGGAAVLGRGVNAATDVDTFIASLGSPSTPTQPTALGGLRVLWSILCGLSGLVLVFSLFLVLTKRSRAVHY